MIISLWFCSQVMAVFGDSEEIRYVDRIRAIAFREARDAGASFITRSWVAAKIKRSERFVSEHWNKDPYDAAMDVSKIGLGGKQLSLESREIVDREVRKKKRSVRDLSKILEEERHKDRPKSTVHDHLRRCGFKPFHVVKKPLKTALAVENRLWFANFLRDWDSEDFLHLAPSDEFFIYSVRRPNFQNDRVWALTVDEIPEQVRTQQLPAHPSCVGIFLCFTAKSLMWVIKDDGQKWDGEYFRETVLQKSVIPFLKRSHNVISKDDVCFLHDNAPCMKSFETQALMRNSGIDFFHSNQWPGNSPDLNAAEHLGAILKGKVESRIIEADDVPPLRTVVEEELEKLKRDRALFHRLLESYPSRIKAVLEAKGGHTDY